MCVLESIALFAAAAVGSAACGGLASLQLRGSFKLTPAVPAAKNQRLKHPCRRYSEGDADCGALDAHITNPCRWRRATYGQGRTDLLLESEVVTLGSQLPQLIAKDGAMARPHTTAHASRVHSPAYAPLAGSVSRVL